MNDSKALCEYFDRSLVGVVVTDPSGLIEYANEQFTKLTGYPAVELVGQHVSLFGRQTEAQRTEMWAVVQAGSGWQGDVQGERKDGYAFFARLAISPIADEESTTAGLLCLAVSRPPAAAEAATLHATAVAQSCSPLSEREHEVLRHLASGLTDGEIAERLGVSARTVGDYISAVLRKLNVPNRTSAVVVAEKLRVAQSQQPMGEEEVVR